MQLNVDDLVHGFAGGIIRVAPDFPQIIEKGWGREIIFANNEDYCGKALEFDRKGARTSLHFHLRKHETFFVTEGDFRISTRDRETGAKHTVALRKGDRIETPPGKLHRIICDSENGTLIEVSTHDDPADNYRVEPGDSQNA